MFKTETALEGSSVGQKNPRGELIKWAKPRAEFRSNGARSKPGSNIAKKQSQRKRIGIDIYFHISNRIGEWI